jgi:hypothetical protein
MYEALGYIPNTLKKKQEKQGTVAPVCNPSYFRGRDQEDHGLRQPSSVPLKKNEAKEVGKNQ